MIHLPNSYLEIKNQKCPTGFMYSILHFCPKVNTFLQDFECPLYAEKEYAHIGLTRFFYLCTKSKHSIVMQMDIEKWFYMVGSMGRSSEYEQKMQLDIVQSNKIAQMYKFILDTFTGKMYNNHEKCRML